MKYLDWLKQLVGIEDSGFIPYSDERFQAYKSHVLSLSLIHI